MLSAKTPQIGKWLGLPLALVLAGAALAAAPVRADDGFTPIVQTGTFTSDD